MRECLAPEGGDAARGGLDELEEPHVRWGIGEARSVERLEPCELGVPCARREWETPLMDWVSDEGG